jgi:dihydroneopterin aldolase
MDRIYLTGISGFAFHGVYENERKEGQKFSVDIVAEVDLYPAGASDNLNDSVDYSLIAQVAHQELVGEPCNLIEAVAERIAARILQDFEKVQSVLVTLHKPDAAVGVAIADIAIQIERRR